MSEQKAKFASKVGVVAATVGSAVGLGTIWRFPAVVQENGGAAFLLLYLGCVLLLGIPVMVAEFALGRAGGSDAIGSFKNLGAKRGWWGIGALSILGSYSILCFYMVVAGWTFEYLWQSVTGFLYEPVDGQLDFVARMEEFTSGGWNPLISTYIVIFINLLVLIGGVQKGIERLSNIMMPVLFVILLVLCVVSLSLPGAVGGLKFFFAPDFSLITPTVVVKALGQAFFSLSLGMGILITYASYYKPDVKLMGTSITVSLLVLVVSVMMGIVIFPAVVTFGLSDATLEGTTLVFVTLPEVFAQLPGTQVWSILFFLLLFVAALTSTISIAEVSVAFLSDRFGFSRFKSVVLVLLPLIVLSTICAERAVVFNALDYITTNIVLPLVSLGVCVYVGWFAPAGMLNEQLANGGRLRGGLTPAITCAIRFVAPALILAVLIGGLI